MKVLDPQSALLTTAEVYQFLKENPVREADKKVGSYATVNIVNNHVVRRDDLKKYELTKSEILTLVNLGIGCDSGSAPATNGHAESDANGAAESAEQDDEDGAPQESDLNKSLFRLVVEESDERFAGDRGNQQIDEILTIINESLRGKTQVNGHAGKSVSV